MERTRIAALAALVVVLTVGGAALAAGSAPGPQLGPVTWPPSTLLVSEVQTGGASASDEFAEITNVGSSAVDLAGLEIVYVTSTGGTVTRKASWSASVVLGPGRHLFIANTSGVYASLADATYSGGLAATGGAIVLRPVGGAPIDALGWGDATNAFVEGSAAAAPASGASVERKPGGTDGNTADTNDNAADWFAQASPNAQSLAAPPVPAPGASPSTAPTATAAPTGAPTPASTPASTPFPSPTPAATPAQPTIAPTPVATPEPTAAAEPSATPEPTPAATAAPTPFVTPAATPEPTTAPTPETTPVPTGLEPTPSVLETPPATQSPSVSIIDARGQANGTTARITGVLATHLGALEAGRKAFVQDDTGGIALYLDVAVTVGLPADTQITVVGTLDDRFAERTLRVNLADIVDLGELQRPPPWHQQTGGILEAVEGYRVIVQGVTVGAPTEMADGLGLMVDDGTGAVRVIVGPDALGGASAPSGTHVVAVGPVGQRDSSGTGLSGYRIHVTEESDFGILAPPTPSPTATPTPTPAPTPSPSATPAPTRTPSPTALQSLTATPRPSPTPRPSATPGPTAPPTISIVEARGASVGTVVTVAGVVTAEGGRLGLPPLIAIADGTGGIVVRVPDGIKSPARGATVQVKGPLADPYGQLELRPGSPGLTVTGQGSLPTPLRLAGVDMGESTEGRLAEVTGTLSASPKVGTGGDLTFDLVDAAGTTFRAVSDGSSGIVASTLVKGSTYRLTGIVGQRASRKGALDGYRLHVRDRSDVALVAGAPGPGASAAPGASGAPSAVKPISTVIALPEGTSATIEATVTAGVSLLDSTGRRIVVQDASGAIEVLLPAGSGRVDVGARLRLSGRTGRAWGAPRLAAALVDKLAGDGRLTPRTLSRTPAERDEWQLVRLSGSISKVERLGDRWRAEITLADGTKAPVHGQAGAGIPSTAIVVGRRITVTGIVKRPYPTASDRRFAVLPRNGNDVSVGPAGNGSPTAPIGNGQPDRGSNDESGPGQGSGAVDVTPDTDLAALSEHVGQRVRVGGLIARLADDGFDLDDGTALARIELRDGMAELRPHLREGEAVAATGIVELVDGAPVVVVGDDGSLLRVGSLGQALPIGGFGALPEPSASAAVGPPTVASGSGVLGTDLAPTSLLAMAGLTLASVLATILRRRLAQRRLREILVERLASVRQKEVQGPG